MVGKESVGQSGSKAWLDAAVVMGKIKWWEKVALLFVRGRTIIEDNGWGMQYGIYIKKWRGKVYVLKDWFIGPKLD